MNEIWFIFPLWVWLILFSIGVLFLGLICYEIMSFNKDMEVDLEFPKTLPETQEVVTLLLTTPEWKIIDSKMYVSPNFKKDLGLIVEIGPEAYAWERQNIFVPNNHQAFKVLKDALKNQQHAIYIKFLPMDNPIDDFNPINHVEIEITQA